MAGIGRVSLQRMRADWPIVAAAWLITALSAVLFAAGVIYPAAAAESGLRRALAEATVASRSLEVQRYEDIPNVDALDSGITAVLIDVIGRSGGDIVRDWRRSATLGLVARPNANAGDQVELGFLDGIADHASLVAGTWPAEAAGAAPASINAVLAEQAATDLAVQVGDTIAVRSGSGSDALATPLHLVGIYAPTDPDEPFWNGDAQLLTGLHENNQYRTFGPFITSRSVLMASVADELDVRWHVFPDFANLAVDDAGELASKIDGIAGRVLDATGAKVIVNSELPVVLRSADRSLLVSRTSVVLLMAQLALLAGYAIVLVATLLVDHRRIDTALLRARGAASSHVARLSLIEAFVFAATAALAAPTLAAAAVGLFNVVGPLADVGLTLQPRITTDAYLAAAAAGLLCIVLLVLPAALSARAFAQEQGGRSRQETRTFGQRLGLDVVLIALTGIALWQLRLYGAPLTRSVQGQLGLDPLLVAAPAIGLVAGGVLALRLLPLLAQVMEATVSRGRGLLTSLGARQLARRPLRYTRSALLLVLSVSMGVFALSYAATWAGSQRDQATYQAGADVRMPAPASTLGLPTWAIAGALADEPDVAAATPVERLPEGVKFAATGSADLLTLDARTAASVVLLRSDASPTPFAAMLQPLAAARPAPKLPALPDGASFLRIVPNVDIREIGMFVFDETSGDATVTPIDPAQVAVQVSATVIVQDAHGLMYQFRAPATPILGPNIPTGAAAGIVIPLQAPGGDAQPLHLEGPVSVASATIELWLEEATVTNSAFFGIGSLGSGTSVDGPWTTVPIDGAGPWSAGFAFGREPLEDVPATRMNGVSVEVQGDADGANAVFGNGTFTPSAVVSFLPNGIDATGGALPVIANRAFSEAFDAGVGEIVTADVASRFTRLSIVGVMDTFPTTDPAEPLLIADEATVSLLRLRTNLPTRPVDEWWLAAHPGRAEALATSIAGTPFERAGLVSATGRARQLSTDPVALGIIGALTLGFVTTGLFAIVGLTVSAGVSARQQRTEFALLRALGLSGRQLSGSLWLEHGSVVILGLVAGTVLGLLIAWLVLPFVTVTQGGVAPVPSVLIEVPWDRVLVLNVVSGGALAVAVLVIGRALRRLRVGATLRMGEE